MCIARTVGLRLCEGCGKKMSATFFLCTMFSLCNFARDDIIG